MRDVIFASAAKLKCFKSGWALFAALSIWALAITWFIQLYLLSYPLVHWSAGDGLLLGHDAVTFHEQAKLEAIKIAENGWSEWELRPQNWGVSGILSAWYAIVGPKPWLWAPWQAMLFGLCAVLMQRLATQVTGDRLAASIAVLVLMLLPGAALLYVFPHRDIFVFLGFLLLVYGGVLLVPDCIGSHRRFFIRAVWAWVLIVSGILLAWTVRPFSAEIFLGLMIIITAIIAIISIHQVVRSPKLFRQSLIGLAACGAVTIFILFVHGGGSFIHELPAEPAVYSETLQSPNTSTDREVNGSQAEAQAAWQTSFWLPSSVDVRLRGLAGARDRVIRIDGHGRSAVDLDVHFRSVGDILGYAPRAAQLGFLAPFPTDWVPLSEAPPNRNLERVVMGLEMVLVYLLLPFLVVALWRYRRRSALWLTLVPSVAWIMVYASTVPVVGSLVRYRYGPFLLLLCIALATLIHWILRRTEPLHSQVNS